MYQCSTNLHSCNLLVRNKIIKKIWQQKAVLCNYDHKFIFYFCFSCPWQNLVLQFFLVSAIQRNLTQKIYLKHDIINFDRIIRFTRNHSMYIHCIYLLIDTTFFTYPRDLTEQLIEGEYFPWGMSELVVRSSHVQSFFDSPLKFGPHA